MDRLGVENDLAGFEVQRAQEFLGVGDRGFVVAADPEHVAAVGDFDAAPQFDLAQMGVEGAGEVGQAFGVGGVQREIPAVRA